MEAILKPFNEMGFSEVFFTIADLEIIYEVRLFRQTPNHNVSYTYLTFMMHFDQCVRNCKVFKNNRDPVSYNQHSTTIFA